jgi:protein-S-isoprenylcysteine O-methyltransferase Ste14
MKRILKALAFVIAFYVIPLVAQPALLVDARIMFLMLVCMLLLLTQPDFSLRDVRRLAETDRYSVVLIMAAGGITQIAPVIEWAYRTNREWNAPWIIMGSLMLVGGTTFRIWAIKTLGKFFTSTVEIQDDHQLIKTGPYRYMKHPSYFGAYIAVIGSAVLLRAPISIGIAVVVMGAAYAYRIALENRVLRKRFGESAAR